MNIEVMKKRYDAAGYHKTIDYRNEESHKSFTKLKPFISKLINKGSKALDLGCNAGRCSFLMEESGAQVTGIDISSIAISIAREIAADIGSGCIFTEGDILNMSFGHDAFDLALFPLNIIEFEYHDVEVLCRQLNDILITEGLFIMTMQDCVERFKMGRECVEDYNINTGMHKAFNEIPGKGVFEYQTYFWTLAFAKHIIGRYFTLEHEVQYDEGRYLLVYKNRQP